MTNFKNNKQQTFIFFSRGTCSRHENSGPAGLPRSKEEILFSVYLYMRYHAPMMFTCIKVLSRLVVKGGYTCEIWIVGTSNKLLGGPRQTRWIRDRNCSRHDFLYISGWMQMVMIYFPETIIQWIRHYWEYLHTSSSKLCTLTHTVHARVLKPWRGHLPSVFSSCHVLLPPLSGLNWHSLTPLGGPGPFTSKMASLFTGSTHTPSPGFRTGMSWERAQSNPRTRPGWTYSRGAATNSRSSMHKMYEEIMMLRLVEKKKKKIKMLYIILLLIVYFLRRLKINHDSHEFILEFGTVSNSNFQCMGHKMPFPPKRDQNLKKCYVLLYVGLIVT